MDNESAGSYADDDSAARLAADEHGFLDTIHDMDDYLKQKELAMWIGDILGEELNPDELFDDLESGVRLLYLAKSIQLTKCGLMKDADFREKVEHLKPDTYSVVGTGPPKRASLIAKQRSNIAKFLEWCGDIGVPRITIFQTDDLTHRKNLRQVTTCLFYVSKIASRFGVEPPSSVKEELHAEKYGASNNAASTNGYVLSQSPFRKDDYGVVVVSRVTELESPVSEDTVESFDSFAQHCSLPADFPHKDAPRTSSRDVTKDDGQSMFRPDEVYFRPLHSLSSNSSLQMGEDGNSDLWTHSANGGPRVPSEDVSTTDRGDCYHNSGEEYTPAYAPTYYDSANEDSVLHHMTDSQEIFDYTTTTARSASPSRYAAMQNRPVSPFRLPAIPADATVSNCSTDEPDSEDYECDESCDEIVYVDAAVGDDEPLTKDLFLYVPKSEEIMINFPPYFEFLGADEKITAPPREYTVATVGDDVTYAKPIKPQRRRDERVNDAFQDDATARFQQYPSRYHSLDGINLARRGAAWSYTASCATISTVRVRTPVTHNQVGTQTHFTYSQDTLRIISELDDYSELRKEHSSLSSLSTRGSTTILRTDYQRVLPTSDRDVSIIQESDLVGARPARFGSITASTRLRNRDVDSETGGVVTPLRRGLLRRTSSRISQRIRKAALATRKYTNRTILVAILFGLALCVLAAMLGVFLTR